MSAWTAISDFTKKEPDKIFRLLEFWKLKQTHERKRKYKIYTYKHLPVQAN